MKYVVDGENFRERKWTELGVRPSKRAAIALARSRAVVGSRWDNARVSRDGKVVWQLYR